MKVTKLNAQTKMINRNHRKENAFAKEYKAVAIVENEIIEVLTCRVYATNARHYCCIWLHSDLYLSSSAYAGGYGYHRESAAISEALENMGFEFDKNFYGTGKQVEALEAVTEYLGYKNFKILQSFA